METTLTVEAVDRAIAEIYIRAGQKKPQTAEEFRWAAEGPRERCVVHSDTLRDWIGHDGSRAVGDKAGGARG